MIKIFVETKFQCYVHCIESKHGTYETSDITKAIELACSNFKCPVCAVRKIKIKHIKLKV